MRSIFGKTHKRAAGRCIQPQNNQSKRSQPKRFEYGTLEDRRVLAAITSFSDGLLSVSLTGNDMSAVISVQDGLATVNGSTDLQSKQDGNQTQAALNIRDIRIIGDGTMTGQAVGFAGDFSAGTLRNVTVDLVNSISVTGNYNISNNLTLTTVQTDGGIGDSDAGQLTVGGTTSLNSRQNVIALNNLNHDFRGPVSIRTAAIGQNNVRITDVNNIEIVRAEVRGNLTISTPSGSITDTEFSVISVIGEAEFKGQSVTLGDSDKDTVELFRVTLNTGGHAELHEDGNLVFSGSSEVGSLRAVALDDGIFDSRTSSLVVAGNADFQANRIRIGEHSADMFTAGSLTFNAAGHVDFFENNGTHIVGSNSARTLDITSLGDMTDGISAMVDVEFTTGLEADNITLGDSMTDRWNMATFYFYSEGDIELTADSNIRIVEPKNFARNLTLNAMGTISDADDAAFNVAQHARFIATESVTIGDTENDEFNAGSIQWNTGQRFFVHEDSNTVIANPDELAKFGSQSPAADIISDGSVTNAEEAVVRVGSNMSILATNIQLGDQRSDEMNFGSLTVNTYEANGAARVSEDSSTLLTGDSHVRTLQLNSTGSILDAVDANTLVVGASTFRGTLISVGDDASFNTGVITLDSSGNVFVHENNSSVVLTGINNANSMTLIASGDVLDTGFAETRVNFRLTVSGSLINLGGETTDVLEFACLNSDSKGNTNIHENGNASDGEEGFTIVGNNFSGDRLILHSNGSILDADDARIVTTTRAAFTGLDVIIGDSDDDCFIVLDETEGGESLIGIDAPGVKSVTRGGCAAEVA